MATKKIGSFKTVDSNKNEYRIYKYRSSKNSEPVLKDKTFFSTAKELQGIIGDETKSLSNILVFHKTDNNLHVEKETDNTYTVFTENGPIKTQRPESERNGAIDLTRFDLKDLPKEGRYANEVNMLQKTQKESCRILTLADEFLPSQPLY